LVPRFPEWLMFSQRVVAELSPVRGRVFLSLFCAVLLCCFHPTLSAKGSAPFFIVLQDSSYPLFFVSVCSAPFPLRVKVTVHLPGTKPLSCPCSLYSPPWAGFPLEPPLQTMMVVATRPAKLVSELSPPPPPTERSPHLRSPAI